MREWLVIEDSRKNAVFAPEEAKAVKGFIPRDVAERILGRRMDGNQWFTREESDLMRAHPEWTTNIDDVEEVSTQWPWHKGVMCCCGECGLGGDSIRGSGQ